MVNKQPRFFCDFCGTEVKRNDRICPKCGKFFSAVRCPACGMTGQAALFVMGCPACGYAVLPGTANANNSAAKKKQKTARKTHSRVKGPRHATTAKSRPRVAGDPLPLWVYIAVTALLAVVVVAIIRWI